MPSRTPSNNFAVDFAGDFGRSGEFSSSLTIASDRQKNSTPTLPAENWSLENYRPATPPPCDWSHQTPPLATPQCALLRIGPSINTIGSRAEHRCEPAAIKAPLKSQRTAPGRQRKPANVSVRSRLANCARWSVRRRREDQRQDARDEASRPDSLPCAFFRPSGIRHSRRFEPFITAGFPRRSAARGFSEGFNGSSRLFCFIITD